MATQNPRYRNRINVIRAAVILSFHCGKSQLYFIGRRVCRNRFCCVLRGVGLTLIPEQTNDDDEIRTNENEPATRVLKAS